jgi:hypothetical protein
LEWIFGAVIAGFESPAKMPTRIPRMSAGSGLISMVAIVIESVVSILGTDVCSAPSIFV